MLKISPAQIPDGGMELIIEKDPRIFPAVKEMIEGGEIAVQKPLRYALRIQTERDMIRVDGHMTLSFILTCSRCLESFEHPINQPFTLRFARQETSNVQSERGAEIEVADDQIGLSFYEGDEIDLRDALQEQIILALPIKPLCREECKGLCPHCGKDLNQGDCECRLQSYNGPFEKLKSFKMRLDKES